MSGTDQGPHERAGDVGGAALESNERSAEDDAALHGAVRRGLKWSFANVGLARLASILMGIALARILVPDDFGVFAPALAIVNILFGVNDLGLLLAVVRWKGDLRVAARTAHTLALLFSGVLYALVFMAAPWFSEVINSPATAPVLRLLALTVFIDGWTTVSHGLLVRDFHQDRLAKAEFAAMPVAVTVSIGLALAGAGVWSLVVGQVLASCVSGVLVYLAAPFRAGFGWSTPAARKMLAYGLPLAGTSLVEYSLLNVDYIIISRALDPAALGFYLLAFNISSWPLTTITDAVRRVSIAGFARLEDDTTAVRDNFGRALATLLTAALPITIAMALLAVPLIGFLYGDRWLPSAPVLQFLLILSFARMAIGFMLDLLMGVGRTPTSLALKLTWLVVLVPALQIGVHADGIRGVAIAHSIVAWTVALPMFAIASQRAGAKMSDVVRPLVRPVVAAGVITVVGLLIRDHLGGNFTTLAAGASVMLTIYLMLVLRRAAVTAAIQRVRSRRNPVPTGN
jgi:O-antigen/teichoic acid export membrane protein